MSYVAELLFQSRTRTALLELLFRRRLTASVSELARRASLSPRAVAAEVRNLSKAGLVQVQGVAGADLVSARLDHPAAQFIEGLLATPVRLDLDEDEAKRLRESLVAWGAPLVGHKAVRHSGLEETLVDALGAAHRDGTLLRVLPVVLATNLERLDWVALKEGARRRKLKAELGMLVELTAELLGQPRLTGHVRDLRDRRRHLPRYLPEARSRFEQQLAKERAPRAAKRWGFYMNVSEESLRTTFQRHLAQVHGPWPLARGPTGPAGSRTRKVPLPPDSRD